MQLCDNAGLPDDVPQSFASVQVRVCLPEQSQAFHASQDHAVLQLLTTHVPLEHWLGEHNSVVVNPEPSDLQVRTEVPAELHCLSPGVQTCSGGAWQGPSGCG